MRAATAPFLATVVLARAVGSLPDKGTLPWFPASLALGTCRSAMQQQRERGGSVVDQSGISIVVPVYRSEAMLRLLVDRLRTVCVQLAQPFEIILVNDGSPDGSWCEIAELAQEHPSVRGIDLMRNYGQHNALLCGVRAAQYGVIVTLDDDLQNPPEEIPMLLAKLDEGFEVVYGSPRQGAYGRYRRMASW